MYLDLYLYLFQISYLMPLMAVTMDHAAAEPERLLGAGEER